MIMQLITCSQLNWFEAIFSHLEKRRLQIRGPTQILFLFFSGQPFLFNITLQLYKLNHRNTYMSIKCTWYHVSVSMETKRLLPNAWVIGYWYSWSFAMGGYFTLMLLLSGCGAQKAERPLAKMFSLAFQPMRAGALSQRTGLCQM